MREGSGPRWRIEMLGRLRVRGDGGLVSEFRSRQAAALLARLASPPGSPWSREALARDLWPDTVDEDRRATYLRQALSSLRRILEPGEAEREQVLARDRGPVFLNPGAVRTDVQEFDAALTECKAA